MQDPLSEAMRPYTKALKWTKHRAGECILSGDMDAALKLYAVQAALVKLATALAKGVVLLPN